MVVKAILLLAVILLLVVETPLVQSERDAGTEMRRDDAERVAPGHA